MIIGVYLKSIIRENNRYGKFHVTFKNCSENNDDDAVYILD